MIRKNQLSFEYLLVFFISFAYVVLRAWKLDFTYDECWTFLGYATQPTLELLTNAYPAANNHLLHSLLMKWSWMTFGMEPIALRLPLLLSFIFFARALWLLLRMDDAPSSFFIWFTVLLQPYLLDYFVLARGYGLALALFFWALVYARRWALSEKPAQLILFGLLLLLAAAANFTYLLLGIASWLVLLFVMWKRRSWKLTFLFTMAWGVVTAATLWVPLRALIEAKELYYGGQSLINDTFGSLSARMVYQSGYSSWGAWLLGAVLILITLALIRNVRKERGGFETSHWAGAVLLVTLLGNVVQHYVLGSPFLVDRTALFVIPMLIIALPLVFHLLRKDVAKRLRGVMVLGAGVLILSAVNRSYTVDFKEYAEVSKAMRWIHEHEDQWEVQEYSIGKSKYLNAPINYYKELYAMERVQQSGLEFCNDDTYPVYLLFEKDLSCLNHLAVDTMAHFEVSSTYLLLPKEEGPTFR